MIVRALVVDDDEKIIRTVCDILDSLGHEYDAVGDQESAQKLLGPDKYAYVLLDLEIPVRPGHLSRIQNGKNLLARIRQTSGMENVPVVVVTGHGNDSYELAVSVMKVGAVDYVSKPLDGDKLDKAIHEALAKDDQVAPKASAKTGPKKLMPFSDEKRQMIIYEDRVTICGIEVWRDCGQPHMRTFLLRLNKKEGGGWARLRGRQLMKGLDRNESNPVGRPIKDFCDGASDRLKEQRHLECGRYDIIASTGGYHFTDWMDVQVAGEESESEPPSTTDEPAVKVDKLVVDVASEHRQRRILEWIDNGERLAQKDVIERFRREKKPATIKRDLQKLRNKGMIETNAEGYYVRSNKRKS